MPLVDVVGEDCLCVDDLPNLWTAWKARHAERDVRFDRMDRVMRGDLSVFDPDDEEMPKGSPNLIQVAVEDTAEAAASLPSVRVDPVSSSEANRKNADRMEIIAAGYLSSSKIDLVVPRTLMELVGFGLAAWVVSPDFSQRIPLIEKRDVRFCYPEPGWRPGDVVRRCMFVRDVYVSQLPKVWREKLLSDYSERGFTPGESPLDRNVAVSVVEYYSESETVIAGIYQSKGTLGGYHMSGGDVKVPVEFARWDNKLGVCPVVIGQRNSFDGEPRGQMDQVVGPFEAHVRLMGAVLDYADQAVYSDIWVKDLVGAMPWGGGSYIELGPQGQIGRVPPAVSSLDVQRDLAGLTDAIHIGGRWPKSRPGEVDQAIASAKFVEATAGVMNTAIRQYHLIQKYMIEQALRLCFLTDVEYFPGKKMITGVVRNQQFVEEYDTKHIDVKHRVRADYGLGLGRDPAQSAVLHLQYAGSEFISKDFVQENIDGLSDVARERSRIDTQKFREMALAKLLMGLEQGTIPEEALVQIARARANGENLFDLYEKYVVEPKQAVADQALTPGGGGDMLMPGAVGPDGAGVPVGPDGAPMPGGGGPPVPAAPPPTQMLARLGSPAGPGGQIGTQILGEPGGG